MSAIVAKKKPNRDAKIELRAEADWVERVERHADRLGLSRSAYVRMVVTQAMDATEQEDARRKAPRN